MWFILVTFYLYSNRHTQYCNIYCELSNIILVSTIVLACPSQNSCTLYRDIFLVHTIYLNIYSLQIHESYIYIYIYIYIYLYVYNCILSIVVLYCYHNACDQLCMDVYFFRVYTYSILYFAPYLVREPTIPVSPRH